MRRLACACVMCVLFFLWCPPSFRSVARDSGAAGTGGDSFLSVEMESGLVIGHSLAMNGNLISTTDQLASMAHIKHSSLVCMMRMRVFTVTVRGSHCMQNCHRWGRKRSHPKAMVRGHGRRRFGLRLSYAGQGTPAGANHGSP